MSTNPHSALIVAGIVFAFVALMHLLRISYKTQIIIGGKLIPIWISMIGFIIPLVLSIWMFIASAHIT